MVKRINELVLFNTLTRQKELFTPIIKNRVSIYSCGPTVYDYAHIGHFRAYIFVDLLNRMLRYNNYNTVHVMNITDVGHLTDDGDSGEDKIEKKACLESKSVWDIAKFYTDNFFAAMTALNVLRPDVVCKATDHIKEMINMVRMIEKNNCTYKISDGIYFDTTKLSDYGKLARFDIDMLREGARVEPNIEKKHPSDFALWKFPSKNQKRQMEWDSPWGVGFPGWHIECTAMAVKYLGKDIDIHTGGIDHIPVHHTNEIAQAQGAFQKEIVKFWLHNEFVLVNGEKMSKSKNNFYTMKDIIDRGLNPLTMRYFFLQAHYRSPMNFTWKALHSAHKGLVNLYNRIQNMSLSRSKENLKFKSNIKNHYRKKFASAINDDLNTPKALAILWDCIKDEKILDTEKLSAAIDFDKVLGLRLNEIKLQKEDILPPQIKKLADLREEARQCKDYKLADRLRIKIEKMDYEVHDTASGQVVKHDRKSILPR